MFTATEVEFLLKACATYGVTHFKAGDIDVTFKGYSVQTEAAPKSQTQDLAEQVRNDHEWMTQQFPPQQFPEDM